jgi:hypothetical protein
MLFTLFPLVLGREYALWKPLSPPQCSLHPHLCLYMGRSSISPTAPPPALAAQKSRLTESGLDMADLFSPDVPGSFRSHVSGGCKLKGGALLSQGVEVWRDYKIVIQPIGNIIQPNRSSCPPCRFNLIAKRLYDCSWLLGTEGSFCQTLHVLRSLRV